MKALSCSVISLKQAFEKHLSAAVRYAGVHKNTPHPS